MSTWHLLLIEDSDEDVTAMLRGLPREELAIGGASLYHG
jgi:hypothetical protein